MDLRISEPAARALGVALRARGWRLVTAESCTGGLVAAACTAVAGSSDWFDRGFVTYSAAAKTEVLGVSMDCIASHGVVSREVACGMASGALMRSRVQLALAVTGIAGPSGGSAELPVGTVWLGVAQHGAQVYAERWLLSGDRTAVREQAVMRALALLLQTASTPG